MNEDVDLEIRDSQNGSVLQRAVDYGAPANIQYLINCGCKIDYLDLNVTIDFISFQENNVEIIPICLV